MMDRHKLTDRQWATSLRDAQSVVNQQACAKTDLMPVLVHELRRKLEGRVSREVMENLAIGVRETLGRRGMTHKSDARRYLEACIEGIAEEFAEAFAETVAEATREHVEEHPPRVTTMAATGGE